jgi:hypothetical protein
MRIAAELQVADLADRTDTLPAIKTLHAPTLPPTMVLVIINSLIRRNKDKV